MDNEEKLKSARKAIIESLEITRGQIYMTKGKAWRQIIASLAFETPADLSLVQYFDDEQEQARFQTITQAFMDGNLPLGDNRNYRDLAILALVVDAAPSNHYMPEVKETFGAELEKRLQKHGFSKVLVTGNAIHAAK